MFYEASLCPPLLEHTGMDGWLETDVSTHCWDPEAQIFWNTTPKHYPKHTGHVTNVIRNTQVTWLKCFKPLNHVTKAIKRNEHFRSFPRCGESAFDWQVTKKKNSISYSLVDRECAQSDWAAYGLSLNPDLYKILWNYDLMYFVNVIFYDQINKNFFTVFIQMSDQC